MTRLNEIEISNLLAIDSLVSMKFLPSDMLAFSRQKKRLNISKDGLGRSEVIEIFKTPLQENEEQKKRSFLQKIMGK
jgi:polyhydroxyalkanoate synthesis regulator protein